MPGSRNFLSDKDCSVTYKGSSDGEFVIKRAALAVNYLLRLLDKTGSPNLGTLLIGFLHYFGLSIDFARMRLVLKGKDGNEGGIFWQSQRQCPTPLWIEDPLRPGVNVGASSFAMCNVQAAFRDMLQILTTPISNVSDSTKNLGISSQKRSLPYLDRLFDTGAFEELQNDASSASRGA